MRVVITGATSMIGVALIEECIQNGDSVLAIVRRSTQRLERLPKSELIQIAYADLESLDRVNGDGNEYDVLYHFAWAHTIKSERDNAFYQEKNIKYSLDAVKLAKRLGCKKFIGAGSQAEYGRVDGIIDENTPCNPLIAYGMGKLAANLLSRKLCEELGIIFVWGRIFSVYGINDNKDTMIDYALTNFAKNKVAKFSSGEQSWNYLFEEDAGKIFYKLGITEGTEGVYCVAHPESKKLKCYIFEMANSVGKRSLVQLDTSGNPMGLEVNISRLRSVVGNMEFIDFNEGIKMVAASRTPVCQGG